MPSTENDPPISVLVVDDEELLAKSCTQILSGEGYQVAVATRGRAGARDGAPQRPDIVLTDLMLPDMDGMALLREIAADRRRRRWW